MRHLVLLSFCFVTACAPDFQVQGRPYSLQRPSGLAAETPAPVIILLHGYSATGWAQNVIFPFSSIVDTKGFVLVSPNGTTNALGKRFWNATDYCCDFDHTGIDDVAFIRALIDDVRKHQAVDRVFVIGHSNGGFMALRLACEASDVIDGVVSVAGATWLEEGHCSGGRAIPTLLVHGTVDETILYDGVADKYPSAAETFRRLSRRASCSDQSPGSATFDFLGDESAETTSNAPTGCTSDVALWTMDGVGHVPSFDSRWTNAVFEWLEQR